VQWQKIEQLTLTKDWQVINAARGRFYKITYLSIPESRQNFTGLIALVDRPSDEDLESTEIFRPQKFNSYSISEIIGFAEPPKRWSYRLAVKQLVFSDKPTFSEIEIYMPVVDITPDQPVINPTISTNKIPTSVSIPAATTTSVKLLPANASGVRKHATFYNGSAKRNLYIDTDSNINNASAVAKVAPGKLYISDMPGWQGEYWGVLADGNDSAASAIAIEEYI
jgi:hypothetical protein